MARDDFRQDVKDALRARVGNRCSNPFCRVPTTGPSSDGSMKVNNIGVAAHIRAAAKGGKRYSSSMTSRERKSIENGIWLCQKCSVDIDRDETLFTVELLEGWKRDAEQKAREELGNRLPNKTDAIDTVVAAISGHSKEVLFSAIPNVHRATEEVLEQLDPRFHITSNHSQGKTNFTIHPKEDVPLVMTFSGKAAQEFLDKNQAMIKHGKELLIETDQLTIEGSKLFEKILSDTPRVAVKLSPQKIPATQKIWLVDENTKEHMSFDDIKGDVSIGKETFTFIGHCCNQLFEYSYTKSVEAKSTKARTNITLNFSKWDGVNIRQLPYFSKVFSLFSNLAQGWKLFTSLEANGDEIMRSRGIEVSKEQFVTDILGILEYIDLARRLTMKLGIDIPYRSDFPVNGEDFIRLAELVTIIEGKFIITGPESVDNCSADMVIGENLDDVRVLFDIEEPINCTLSQSGGEEIVLFGENVTLPPREAIFEAITLDTDVDIESLSAGDSVHVRLVPSKDFKYKVIFPNFTDT